MEAMIAHALRRSSHDGGDVPAAHVGAAIVERALDDGHDEAQARRVEHVHEADGAQLVETWRRVRRRLEEREEERRRERCDRCAERSGIEPLISGFLMTRAMWLSAAMPLSLTRLCVSVVVSISLGTTVGRHDDS